MLNRKTIIILVLGALAVATTLGAVAYRSVFAATPITTSTSTTTTTTSSGLGWEGGKGLNEGYTNQQLADALGITVDALNTAYQNAYSAALKDAVTKGLITQAQADQLTTNGTVFPFGNHWDNWLTQNGIDFNTYLANALGISVDALKTAHKTAYNANIDQMVTNGNLTQTQADLMKGEYALSNDSTFQSSMQTAFTSAVNAAVTSGVITQAQADQILSNNSNMFMLGRGDLVGRGGGHGHGDGGFMPNTGTVPSTVP
jgi:formaldehyde-activating enzyme involved in methanogenesis